MKYLAKGILLSALYGINEFQKMTKVLEIFTDCFYPWIGVFAVPPGTAVYERYFGRIYALFAAA